MLTDAERRGAVVVVALLLLGAGYDLWRAHAVPPASGPPAQVRVTAPAAPAPAATESSGDTAPRLDLNRADPEALDRLPGIGPTLARRIVAHRNAHGPFRSADELLAVRGIGPRLLARILPLVTVEAPGAAPDGARAARRPGHPVAP